MRLRCVTGMKSLVGLGAMALRPFLPRSRGVLRVVEDAERRVGVEAATRHALLYFVIPLWICAGLADWWHHRATRIEKTSGTHESAIHALMMAEGGLPAMMGLLLDVNAGVLLASTGALAAHQATAAWDVSYAEERRRVTPGEQHVHSLLEVLPLMAVSFLTVLHWDQARALAGLDDRPADFGLRPKREPLSGRYLAGLLGAISSFIVAPFAEELWRCYREDRTFQPRPAPRVPATPALRIAAPRRG
jgi:hypothetical protein